MNPTRLHFVGIGGSGMSGLARLCQARGHAVTGSDRGDSPTVAALRAEGFNVALQQTDASVPANTDTLVISAAVPFDHPEVLEAGRRNLEVVKYAAMLGRVMANPGTVGVAVAGTHGKSSTTSMLGHTLIACGLDPSVIVGAHCPQLGGGHRTGQGPTLIAEACEYDRSFHHLAPTKAVILNVEADHLDIYDGLDAIVKSFAEFAQMLPDESAGGSLLIQHESPHRVAITAKLKCRVETLGFAPQADWQLVLTKEGRRNDEPNPGKPLCILRHQGKDVARWHPAMPGEHMAYNAAAAGVLAHRLGADWLDIAKALEKFAGLDRRMQRIGTRQLKAGGTLRVIDDYGHHPTEVDTTLRALRDHEAPGRLICIFQPHQHSRTRHLLDQFAVSFGAADVVIVPEIFFVRDSQEERASVTSAQLVERLRDRGTQALHIHPLDAIADQVHAMARDGDLVVTMGAGDVWTVARAIVNAAS
ncbi:MAG: UDP-N-acetylmuramate--L-alanine ligase [Planctomycetota bacterium]